MWLETGGDMTGDDTRSLQGVRERKGPTIVIPHKVGFSVSPFPAGPDNSPTNPQAGPIRRGGGPTPETVATHRENAVTSSRAPVTRELFRPGNVHRYGLGFRTFCNDKSSRIP